MAEQRQDDDQPIEELHIEAGEPRADDAGLDKGDGEGADGTAHDSADAAPGRRAADEYRGQGRQQIAVARGGPPGVVDHHRRDARQGGAKADKGKGLEPHQLDVDAHLLGGVGVVAHHVDVDAEAVPVVDERADQDEQQRPQHLYRNAVELAAEDLVGEGLWQPDQGDGLALGIDLDEAAQHEVHAQGGDQRGEVGIDHQPAHADAEEEPGGDGGEDADERVVAGLYDEREDPAGHADGGGKREIDLAHRDHVDEGHDHEEHDRQANQHGPVHVPLREHFGVADKEEGQHDEQDDEGSERRPVGQEEASQPRLIGVSLVALSVIPSLLWTGLRHRPDAQALP